MIVIIGAGDDTGTGAELLRQLAGLKQEVLIIADDSYTEVTITDTLEDRFEDLKQQICDLIEYDEFDLEQEKERELFDGNTIFYVEPSWLPDRFAGRYQSGLPP